MVQMTDRFKNLVHYIIGQCTDRPDQLGAIRLNKALWFSDVIAYQMTGTSITGETYLKRERGPAPQHILQAIRQLSEEGKITVVEPRYEFDTRKFYEREPAPEDLSEEHKQLVHAVLGCMLRNTANQVSEMSHDIIWKMAAEGEEIPLYATLASNPGEMTEEFFGWARSILEKRGDLECGG